MMNKDELLYLLERIADRTASEGEIAQYNSWCDGFRKQDVEIPDMEAIKSGMLSHIHQHIDSGAKIRRIPVRRYIGVAAAVVGIAIGVYFYTSRHLEGSEATRNLYANDIAPGGNNATLTVGYGSPMQLSPVQNTVIVGNDFKYGDGSSLPARGISPLGGERMEGAIPNITATTLRGGMYTIILPDNTKVWLNNDSKLVFPSKFGKNEQRIVKLIGEAYFEVAKDAKRPFVVQSAGQHVTVLGTHFNISAYKGEGIKTTLLEGSVRVASSRGTEGSLNSARGKDLSYRRDDGKGGNDGLVGVILKPNQQSILTGNTIKVTEANIEQDIAWKNGYFRFNDLKIQSIMNQLSRWYDIEVIYEGEMPDDGFNGTLSRYKNISQVLTVLQATKLVHFKIEGRRVTVIR